MQCLLEQYKLLGLRSILVLADSLIVEQPSNRTLCRGPQLDKCTRWRETSVISLKFNEKNVCRKATCLPAITRLATPAYPYIEYRLSYCWPLNQSQEPSHFHSSFHTSTRWRSIGQWKDFQIKLSELIYVYGRAILGRLILCESQTVICDRCSKWKVREIRSMLPKRPLLVIYRQQGQRETLTTVHYIVVTNSHRL